MDAAQSLLTALLEDRTMLVALGIALGVFLVIVGIFYPAPDAARIARRMLAAGGTAAGPATGDGLMRSTDYSPTGLM